MAEYFHRVSFSGLTANLLIVPLLEAVVPIGFMAIFTGWRWVAGMAGLLLKISARIADWHADLEPSWRVPDPPLWLALGVRRRADRARDFGRGIEAWRCPVAARIVVACSRLLLWHPGSPAIEARRRWS